MAHLTTINIRQMQCCTIIYIHLQETANWRRNMEVCVCCKCIPWPEDELGGHVTYDLHTKDH